jgi:uncharacterized coiled-coil DUF342 family protein
MWWQYVITIGSVLAAVGTIIHFSKNLIKTIADLNEKNHYMEMIPGLSKKVHEISDKVDLLKQTNSEQDEKFRELSEKVDILNENLSREKELVLGEARQVLLNEITKAKQEGEITPEKKIVLGELYTQYEINGGNGPIKELWDELTHVKTKID